MTGKREFLLFKSSATLSGSNHYEKSCRPKDMAE